MNKKKRKEGVENLQLVEDHNLNLYRVRYSKHDWIFRSKFVPGKLNSILYLHYKKYTNTKNITKK